jgi:hypothetical protein
MVLACALASAVATPALAQNPQAPLAPAPGTPSGQSNVPPPTPRSDRIDCPPGVDEQRAPSVGQDTTGSGTNLSNQLSESGGVVCPPAGIDPGIVEQPREGGALRVIPPPGSPGGDQSIEPK